MKKIIILIFAALLLLVSCQKTWEWTRELGVNSERINLSKEEGEFTVSVFASAGWEALITKGADWLKLDENSGKGMGTLHLKNDENFEDPARVATLVLTPESGEAVEVYIVQSGTKEAASSIPNDML